RTLSIDAVQKADSGHPGLPLDAAPMAYVLWTRFLKHNPADPQWFDRDRFVLSAGHGSMLLYSLLYLTGYDLPLEEIKKFRQLNSRTAGHPERTLTPGVEISTGPLGQGVANGVGMAIAEAYLASRYNRPDFRIIDHFTYALVSDGDLMEGVASEAASLAGHLQLGKLIYLYDENNVTLSAGASLTFTEDVAKRFEAYGWHVQRVLEGNDPVAIEKAIHLARNETRCPSLIIVRTHIGFGSPHKQDSFEAHGTPLGEEEVQLTKDRLGWPTHEPFYVPPEALEQFRKAVDAGGQSQSQWEDVRTAYAKAFSQEARELEEIMRGQCPEDWKRNLPAFEADSKGLATRKAGGQVLNVLAANIPAMVGGSADLDPSTFTTLLNQGNFQSPRRSHENIQGAVEGGWNYAGRNIAFGVREHAMGGILNGLAAHGGLIPFGATFLTFSDYMRPAIRLAAIMEVGTIYVFTHDSIALGEDGPTHQPVEHLAALRAIPHLTVIRPCDANETVVAWQVAIERRHGPTALILTRQNVPTLDRSACASADQLRKGAYTLSDADQGKPEMIIIATGSEVHLAVEAQKKLLAKGLRARVVSMPSWELFEEQSQSYREEVLPSFVKLRLAVEAGSPQGWCKYSGGDGVVIGIDRFGASAPGATVLKEMGFTANHICEQALRLRMRQ
ncbi:MAG: transketolase, partial [Candidatus Omnitrophica bacterium]|nr:transketolase [Candidatus Omnitrophota bacterium]